MSLEKWIDTTRLSQEQPKSKQSATSKRPTTHQVRKQLLKRTRSSKNKIQLLANK